MIGLGWDDDSQFDSDLLGRPVAELTRKLDCRTEVAC
jgi:hypothetical protein